MRYNSGRGGQTRTDNPSLPKRVRYQLRHAPTITIQVYTKTGMLQNSFTLG